MCLVKQARVLKMVEESQSNGRNSFSLTIIEEEGFAVPSRTSKYIIKQNENDWNKHN